MPANLPNETLIYPGRDCITGNPRFTPDRKPDNARARALLDEVEGQNPNNALVSTRALEKKINTFFRLHSPTVIKRLRDAFHDLPENPDPKTMLPKPRELGNA